MKKFYSILGSALLLLGVTTMSTASVWILVYQPKVPKCLMK